VPKGDEVVPLINRLARRFSHVVLTQDWHPDPHHSFASAHQGKKPFDVVPLSYGPQALWPDHSIQGSPSPEFPPDLQIPHAQLVLRKGYRHNIYSYSAFYENAHKTVTGLAGYLRHRELKRIVLAGLAFDFCVRYSAEDASREGFQVTVIEDPCRGIDIDGSINQTRESFAHSGIEMATAGAILSP